MGGSQFGGIGSSTTATAIIDVPDWLSAYFDPAQDQESFNGLLVVQHTYHASLGTRIDLPWQLALRTTLFWRESPAVSRGWVTSWNLFGQESTLDTTFRVPATRSYGPSLVLMKITGLLCL